MTPPGADGAALAGDPGAAAALAGPPSHPPEPPGPKPAKTKSIQVSPAVLDAARKDGDELLRALRTAAVGLTEDEADARAHTAGPNKIAQEKPQGWIRTGLCRYRNPASGGRVQHLQIAGGDGQQRGDAEDARGQRDAIAAEGELAQLSGAGQAAHRWFPAADHSGE